jgi:hypothetical protein
MTDPPTKPPVWPKEAFKALKAGNNPFIKEKAKRSIRIV